LFQEIFSELKKEREEIKSKKDFGKAKENQIRQYLQEIFKTVKEQLDENTEQEDKEKDDDIDSLVKEVEGFESNLKDLQEKIKKSLQKLAEKITAFPKNKKYLIDEKKVTNSIVELLKKVEKVEEAVNFSKKVISAYLEGKNLSEKEIKSWLSKLEKENFVNSQEVAQYFSKMVNEISQKVGTDTGQRPKNRNIDGIYIIIGLIIITLLK